MAFEVPQFLRTCDPDAKKEAVNLGVSLEDSEKAQEVNTYKSDDLFASTLPLEAKRLLLSQLATQRTTKDGRALEVSFIDIKKAYFNGIPKRKLHLYLPREMGLGTKAVAHLRRCVCGTRDAGMIWEETCTQALLDLGFRRGLASPC